MAAILRETIKTLSHIMRRTAPIELINANGQSTDAISKQPKPWSESMRTTVSTEIFPNSLRMSLHLQKQPKKRSLRGSKEAKK